MKCHLRKICVVEYIKISAVVIVIIVVTFFIVEGVSASVLVFVIAAVVDVEVFACPSVEVIGDNGYPRMFVFKGELNDAIGEVGDASFPVEN